MKKYRNSILAFAIAMSPLCAFFIYIGIYRASIPHLLFCGGLLIVTWGLYISLSKENKFIFWLSFALVNLAWWPLLVQSVSRVIFVIINQGMERADGVGSPVAFLLGLVGEQLFFIPLTFAMIYGVPIALAKRRRTATS